ncbi:MAG: patatin-like phospholipase family protein [Thermoguttaceae bacterium]|jgi:NTE family protein
MDATGNNATRRVAIACQGGGSHAAFAAGVLMELLKPKEPDLIQKFDLVALSGTSGGAICAALAWTALVRSGGDRATAARALSGFWQDLATTTPLDFAVNRICLWFASLPWPPEFSPYDYPPWTENALRRLLTKHVRLEEMPEDRARWNHPLLLVGATDVRSGLGLALPGENLTYNDLVASAAVPSLYRAVRTRGSLFWDGLFTRNPPIRELAKVLPWPIEIWVVQINPQECQQIPTTMARIVDRRNELMGNLSLNQELAFVDEMNESVPHSKEIEKDQQRITLRKVTLDLDLDYVSKFDRGLNHLDRLIQRGREKAWLFFTPQSLWNREKAQERGELAPPLKLTWGEALP